MKTLFDLICVFYLLPAALLAFYCVCRLVRAERKGELHPPAFSVVCIIPMLNLVALFFICMDYTLSFLEDAGEWIRKK